MTHDPHLEHMRRMRAAREVHHDHTREVVRDDPSRIAALEREVAELRAGQQAILDELASSMAAALRSVADHTKHVEGTLKGIARLLPDKGGA